MARRLILLLSFGCSAALAGCTTPPVRSTPNFPTAAFPSWQTNDPQYRIYPGDGLNLTVYSAPELNRDLIVAPDGRINLPLVGAIMAGDRTPAQVEAEARARLGSQLVDPDLAITVTTFGSQKVFVGGQVTTPGAYDLPGEIDALQATFLAGGMLASARTKEIVVIRRIPGGQTTVRTINLADATRNPAGTPMFRLQRFDIVYVPRSSSSEVAQFMQTARSVLPIDFGFYYDLGNANRN
jgi:protein involved in polysaccharide export with SLBB domain